jgi:F-type H+-transporting ATPase subunit delta
MLVDPVARPYAESLFGIARKRSVVDEVGSELGELRDLVGRAPDIAAFLATPVIEPAAKVRHLKDALAGRVSDVVADTLCLIVQKGRFEAFGDIVEAYLAMADEHAGRVRVSLTTAVPVSAALQADLTTALRQGLDRTVELEAGVDPAVLGGAVVTIGDKVYDGSIRSRLSRFRQQISRRAG